MNNILPFCGGFGSTPPFMDRRTGAGGMGPKDLSCPSELALGCVIPFNVLVAVPQGLAITHNIGPNTSVMVFGMVADQSGPDIRVTFNNAQGKPAGLLGQGITSMVNPQYFTWEALQSPYQGFPADIGIVDKTTGFSAQITNFGATDQIFDAIFLGIKPGLEGIAMLLGRGWITPEYAALMKRWLTKTQNGECGCDLTGNKTSSAPPVE